MLPPGEPPARPQRIGHIPGARVSKRAGWQAPQSALAAAAPR